MHGTDHKAFIPLVFEKGDAMQFDWSQEVVVLDGVEQKIKVAHFRLSHSRKPFVVAYPRETQEMLLDAFVQALNFYQGVPQRVLIDNPKTMVIRIGNGKERDFHPRFMALMNHYVITPVACTPSRS
jgi:transposase